MHVHALLSVKNLFDFPPKFFFCIANETQKCKGITEKWKFHEIQPWGKYYAVFKDDSHRWRAGHWVSWAGRAGVAPLPPLPQAGWLRGHLPGYGAVRARRR